MYLGAKMIITESQLRNMIRKTIKESLDEVGDMDALAGAAAHGRMSMGDRDSSLDDFQEEEPSVSELSSTTVPESELLARLKEKAEETGDEELQNIKLTSRIFSREFPADLLDIIYMDIVEVACKHTKEKRKSEYNADKFKKDCIEKVYINTRDPQYAPANTPKSMIDVQGYYPTLRELLARCL